MTDAIRLGPARLEQREAEVRVIAPVTGAGDEGGLWFSVPSQHGHMLDPDVAVDAFALVALLRAMRDGLTLHIEPPLSAILAYRLRVHAVPMLAIIGAEVPLRPVEVRIDTVAERLPNRGGTLTGLSGGVDSFFTLLAHLPGSVPAGEEVTHLLFNNVGSHGQTTQDDSVFAWRLERLTTLAAHVGLPLIPVRSNVDAFIQLDFEQTHSVRNAAVALLFQRSCRRMLYGSAYPYDGICIRPAKSTAYSDPALLPALSTEAMTLMDFGTACNRFQKIEAIADQPIVQSFLDVCVRPEASRTFVNCGRCPKCTRTLTALEIIGRVQEFAGVFDLDAWREVRSLAIYSGLRSRGPYWQELADAMRHRGHYPGGMALELSPWLPGRLYRLLLPMFRRAGAGKA